MSTVIRIRTALVAAVIIFLFTLGLGATPHVYAQDNLPIYTSPIDITSGRIHLIAVAPDREGGEPIEIALPVGWLGPKMSKLTNTPIGAQLDDYWNNSINPKTGLTPRQEACDGKEGMKRQVEKQVRKIGSGFSAYDIACNLATSGIVVVKQVGSTLYLSYQLLNNTVDFYATTPVTCHRDHGTPFCPNDPQFSVRLAIEVWTIVRTPHVCQMTAEGGTVDLHAVQIDTHNVSGDLARNFLDTLFLGNKFPAAELAIQAVEKQMPLPLDDSLKELRESAACTDRSNPAARVLAAFSELETSIELPEGIILRITHPAIAAPRFQNISLPYGPDTCLDGFVWRDAFAGDHVCVTPETRDQAAYDNSQAEARRDPNGAYGPFTCVQGYVWRVARPDDLVCVTPEMRDQTAYDNSQASGRRVLGSPEYPSFTRPNITVQPIANAGDTVQINGQFFPPTLDPTILALYLERDTTSACNGGATELEWGVAGSQLRVDKLRVQGGGCAARYELKQLQPATTYQFRARDCDAVTCSPWSDAVELGTGSVSANAGAVVLTLDGGIILGTATVTAEGTFVAAVTIPADTQAGSHTMQAVSGSAQAQVGVEVANPNTGGGTATIVLTGSYFGETGCPTHPLPDYAQKITTDETFPLFGAGFAPGAVTLYLDTAGGLDLGTAPVGADGTFCQEFQGPPTTFLGDHTLVAVQNSVVQATIPVTVIRPTIVR